MLDFNKQPQSLFLITEHRQYIMDVFNEFSGVLMPSSSQLMDTNSQLYQKQ